MVIYDNVSMIHTMYITINTSGRGLFKRGFKVTGFLNFLGPVFGQILALIYYFSFKNGKAITFTFQRKCFSRGGKIGFVVGLLGSLMFWLGLILAVVTHIPGLFALMPAGLGLYIILAICSRKMPLPPFDEKQFEYEQSKIKSYIDRDIL